MIIDVSTNTAAQTDELRERIEALGERTRLSADGEHVVVFGDARETELSTVLGDLGIVAGVAPLRTAYKLAAKTADVKSRPIHLGGLHGATIGGETLSVFAGPCSVEGRDMLLETAKSVQAAGAMALRGGAFKPRSSPYSFRGLGKTGLEMLAETRAETGMPVVTEVMEAQQIELVAEYVDVLQIGARNMQNFSLLSAVGEIRRPVLLKRGPAASIEELLLAAEYILDGGNDEVILCERGIRTFETATRNTLDISSIPILKLETHLPVIVDPSHACGRADLVMPLAKAAVAAGADGLIIEVHPFPKQARCDGDQSLTLNEFAELMHALRPFASAAKRPLSTLTPGN